jgi:hypothetical protein
MIVKNTCIAVDSGAFYERSFEITCSSFSLNCLQNLSLPKNALSEKIISEAIYFRARKHDHSFAQAFKVKNASLVKRKITRQAQLITSSCQKI